MIENTLWQWRENTVKMYVKNVTFKELLNGWRPLSLIYRCCDVEINNFNNFHWKHCFFFSFSVIRCLNCGSSHVCLNSWHAGLKQTTLLRQFCLQIAFHKVWPVPEPMWMTNHVLLWMCTQCVNSGRKHGWKLKAQWQLYPSFLVKYSYDRVQGCSTLICGTKCWMASHLHHFPLSMLSTICSLTPLSSKAVSAPGLLKFASTSLELQGYHTTITFLDETQPTLPLSG